MTHDWSRPVPLAIRGLVWFMFAIIGALLTWALTAETEVFTDVPGVWQGREADPPFVFRVEGIDPETVPADATVYVLWEDAKKNESIPGRILLPGAGVNRDWVAVRLQFESLASPEEGAAAPFEPLPLLVTAPSPPLATGRTGTAYIATERQKVSDVLWGWLLGPLG